MSWLSLIFAAVLLPATSPAGEMPAPPADWPIFRGDRSLRGVAPGGLAESLELRWTCELGGAIASSPVIASDRVYCGADDEQLHCVALQDGTAVWSYDTGDLVEAPPLVFDGRVYVGSSDGVFHAVNAADGQPLWKYATEDRILGSANWIPATEDRAASVVVGSYDSSLYCFDAASGELRWSYATGDRLNGTPSITGDRIVVGGCDALLHVVSASTGEQLAQLPMGEGCYIAASAAGEGDRIYFGHYGNEFVCVDLERQEVVWRYAHPTQAFFSAPAIGAEVVLFGGRDKRLHCVDKATGEARWTFATRRKVDAAPVLCGDRVVFTSGDGRLRILALADGAELWSYDIGQAIFCSPAVTGGIIITGANDGRLYAFGAADGGGPSHE